jgi:hypothetical protein
MADDLNQFSYFTEIEDTFVRLREKHLLLSPLDWALVESWKERGVPLHIVVHSMEEVFKNHKSAARRRGINSLRYCQSEVEAQYAEWLKSRVGAHDDAPAGGVSTASGSDRVDSSPFGKDAIDTHLEHCRRALIDATVANSQSRLAVALTNARVAIANAHTSFAGEPNVRDLEETLTKIESDLTLALHEAATSDQAKECRVKVETAMASYRRHMTDEAYLQTFDTLLKKHLRELFGIPRLSLFHMK